LVGRCCRRGVLFGHVRCPKNKPRRLFSLGTHSTKFTGLVTQGSVPFLFFLWLYTFFISFPRPLGKGGVVCGFFSPKYLLVSACGVGVLVGFFNIIFRVFLLPPVFLDFLLAWRVFYTHFFFFFFELVGGGWGGGAVFFSLLNNPSFLSLWGLWSLHAFGLSFSPPNPGPGKTLCFFRYYHQKITNKFVHPPPSFTLLRWGVGVGPPVLRGTHGSWRGAISTFAIGGGWQKSVPVITPHPLYPLASVCLWFGSTWVGGVYWCWFLFGFYGAFCGWTAPSPANPPPKLLFAASCVPLLSKFGVGLHLRVSGFSFGHPPVGYFHFFVFPLHATPPPPPPFQLARGGPNLVCFLHNFLFFVPPNPGLVLLGWFGP